MCLTTAIVKLSLRQRLKRCFAQWLRHQAHNTLGWANWCEDVLYPRLETVMYRLFGKPFIHLHYWLLELADHLDPMLPLPFDEDLPF